MFAQTPELIFNSGFESGVTMSPVTSNTTDLLGVDPTYPLNSNWVTDLNNDANIGYCSFQFDNGPDSSRNMELIAEPGKPTNRVLHFWSKHPYSGLGRCQAAIYKNEGLKNIYYSIRMKLKPDVNALKSIKKTFDWFTIMEFWNNPNWLGDPHPFRVSVNLPKLTKNNDSLRIRAYGQTYDSVAGKWNYVWDTINSKYTMPVGKWVKLEVHFIEGNQKNGRFKMIMTPEGGSAITIFDVTDFTHHPDDPSPDGLTHFNPFKLYTQGDLVDSVTNKKKLLGIYWDDFILWKNKAISVGLDDETFLKNKFLYFDTFSNELKMYNSGNDQEMFFVQLTDITGKLLFEQPYSVADNIRISCSGFSNQILIAKIRSNREGTATQKVILDKY